MNTDEHGLILNEITEKIIGCAYEISNVLGCGFLEKVYENALVYEIRKTGLVVAQQYGIRVCYEDIVVGEYIADLLVEERVLVEIKAIKALDKIHLAQCLNYLKATKLPVCLLMNFGKPRVEIQRIVY